MTDVKEKLHLLVDACPNEALLQEIKTLLETSSAEDWWNELSEADQNLLLESEAQYERKKFTSHSELMKRFEEWKKK
jgi:formate hydrogenlyase subunit 6/NADH:ubiquinone oxidoreductase subunit I